MTTPKKLEGLAPRRKAVGLTQQQLADALGVERATVSMWEQGASWPLARMLPALAALLCCSIDQLYAPVEELDGGPAESPEERFPQTAGSLPLRHGA